MQISRRHMLHRSVKTVGAVGSAVMLGKSLIADTASSCFKTPAQAEGPFYPVRDRLDENNDLTKVNGRTRTAVGDIIFMHGYVIDSECKPIKGARIEIWQANHHGKYDHPEDTESEDSRPFDPNFQYWGNTYSDQKGHYLFKTILPGAYSAIEGVWTRPPHIHSKISKLTFHTLVTQFYFDDPRFWNLNEKDRILSRLPKKDQSVVLSKLTQPNDSFIRKSPFTVEDSAKVTRFDIGLERV